jgi:aspartate kinase
LFFQRSGFSSFIFKIMRIFKFGGASVKDAAGIRNVYEVLQITGYDDVLLVV